MGLADASGMEAVDLLRHQTGLLAALRAALPVTESWLVETGAAVGVHAGPDALVACLQPVDA